MMAVRKMGLRMGKETKKDSLIIECQVCWCPCISERGLLNAWQGSSLGYFTTQWLNEFHWSARGESAEDWLNEPKKRREKLPYPPVKIVFPTKKTVQESAAGELVSSQFGRGLSGFLKPFPLFRVEVLSSAGGDSGQGKISRETIFSILKVRAAQH